MQWRPPRRACPPSFCPATPKTKTLTIIDKLWIPSSQPKPINSMSTHIKHSIKFQLNYMWYMKVRWILEENYKHHLIDNQQIAPLVQAEKYTMMVVTNRTNRCKWGTQLRMLTLTHCFVCQENETSTCAPNRFPWCSKFSQSRKLQDFYHSETLDWLWQHCTTTQH